MTSVLKVAGGLILLIVLVASAFHFLGGQQVSARSQKDAESAAVSDAERMMTEGQRTFRFDTFGDESF
jgi:hypothetical protein